MNDAEDTALENENLICETVKDLTQDELDHTALKNVRCQVVSADMQRYERSCGAIG